MNKIITTIVPLFSVSAVQRLLTQALAIGTSQEPIADPFQIVVGIIVSQSGDKGKEDEMKGNKRKTVMAGFVAYWARLFETRQKPLDLQSSRQDDGTGMNSPEEKHMHHLRRKMNRTGGVPRGRMNRKCPAWSPIPMQ